MSFQNPNGIQQDRTIKIGSVIAKRFEVKAYLGRGAFSEIFSAYDRKDRMRVALKVEKKRQGDNYDGRLNRESHHHKLLSEAIMQKHGNEESKFIPKFLAFLADNDYGDVMAMEQLGRDLSKVRKHAKDHKLSYATIGLLGQQMIDNIKFVHDHGLLHRDLKPHNIVLGTQTNNDNKTTAYLVDFGLSKVQARNGNIVPPIAGKVSFRGTAAYASYRAMDLDDQSYRDDLEGIFYVLCDLLVGGLPWRKVHPKPENPVDRDKMIKSSKHDVIREIIDVVKRGVKNKNLTTLYCGPKQKESRLLNARQFVKELPYEMVNFFYDVYSLKYDDIPDYEKLKGYMKDLQDKGAETLCRNWRVELDELERAHSYELFGRKFCDYYYHYGMCINPECHDLHSHTQVPDNLISQLYQFYIGKVPINDIKIHKLNNGREGGLKRQLEEQERTDSSPQRRKIETIPGKREQSEERTNEESGVE